MSEKNYKLNLIRIGTRCKTKTLEKYVLKAKTDAIRGMWSSSSSDILKKMKKYEKEIEHAQKLVKVEERRDTIVKVHDLTNIILQHHYDQLTRERPTYRGREIDVWLNLWYVEHEEQLPPKEERKLKYELLAAAAGDEVITDRQSKTDNKDIQVDAEAVMLEDESVLDRVEKVKLSRHWNRIQVQADLLASNTHDYRRVYSKWNIVQIRDDVRRSRIKKGHLNKPMTRQEANAVKNIWQLSMNRRWSLYRHWVNELIRENKEVIADLVFKYNETCKEDTELHKKIACHAVENADIVGMTTTGAAKHNHILCAVQPKIVIIEEAAEVFEAHVFISLTPSVQQLIMIGDHKQLRPKANCYRLEKKYELCVSLFERLARNDFPMHTLEVQHRMRPEIASLICPSIYEKLLNSENVEKYDHVKGVGSDIFFIDHIRPEKVKDDSDRSHSNLHEADYLVALCKYLLNQGYLPSEITVLTMYRGQLLKLKKRMLKKDFDGVRIAVVDDFQGEENKIILLSLVRSNLEGKIGFLNIENRICVSLSRAKIGFFVIGNLSMLRDKDSTVWPQILADLSKRGYVGKALPLYCQVHPSIKVMASTAKDFDKCPEGGCQQKCLFRFNCGHSCPRLCHPSDQEHVITKCRQKCPKVLECGHSCRYKCFECIEGCPPCSEPVVRRIDLCGHEIEMPCHEDPLTFDCPEPCSEVLNCGHVCQELCSKRCTTCCEILVEKKLPCDHIVKIQCCLDANNKCKQRCDAFLNCGHKCQELCSVPCTKDCQIRVEKKLPCDHIKKLSCYIDANTVQCKQPCDGLLDCGHKCSGECGLCQRGRLHVRCRSTCGRTLVCNHVCNFPCTPTCPPCMEECINYCVHSKCQRKCYEPCMPCRKQCEWKCEHYQCSCLCSEICDRPPCDKPCKKSLKCGHPCIGLCGEKCPTKCRVCDRDEVCEIFFGNEEHKDARFIQLEECGHVIEVTACDAWMEQEYDDSKPSEVQFKCCPKCKTQIRKSLRYGNIVKQTLQDYENIKKQQVVNPNGDLAKLSQEVSHKIQEVSSPLVLKQYEYIKNILQSCISQEERLGTSIPPNFVNLNIKLSFLTLIATMDNHLSLMESITGVHESLMEFAISVKDIHYDIENLVKFLMQRLLSDQQISDIESEVYRLMSLIKLLDLWCKVRSHGERSSLTEEDRISLTSQVERVQSSGWKLEKLKEKDHDEVVKFVAKMSEKYKVDGLTDAEKIKPLVKAIGLKQGHWFKCPNGHYYCIGECGGAMEEAECSDCGATVGGQQHTLQEHNQLSTEMDAGAQLDPDQFG